MRLIASLAIVLLVVSGCDGDRAPATSAVPRPDLERLAQQRAALAQSRLPSNACVNEDLINAEQFVRLHTEMMVAGLTCAAAFHDQATFGAYQNFTAAHADRIRRVQTQVGNFLARNQRGNGARLFDTYRTEMANDESQVVIAMSPNEYCRAMRDQYYQVAQLNAQQLDTYLTDAVQRTRGGYRVCSASR